MYRICAITVAMFALAVVMLPAGCAEETPAGWVPETDHSPAVFADLSYEEAQATANSEGKLLILDATARWCRPCKKMDRTTWVDANVENWVRNTPSPSSSTWTSAHRWRRS